MPWPSTVLYPSPNVFPGLGVPPPFSYSLDDVGTVSYSPDGGFGYGLDDNPTFTQPAPSAFTYSLDDDPDFTYG